MRSPSGAGGSPPVRVLIVDDSRTVQRIVSAAVADLGAVVVACASDGEDGLASFREHRPDVVLLDITMPNKDGRECLREILALEPGARVVMLSALSSEEVRKECLAEGARDFIDKALIADVPAMKAKLSAALLAAAAA